MKISLHKGSPAVRGKATCHIVTIGEHEFFFSYETCIGYRNNGITATKTGEKIIAVRLANHWGRTTGRHFKEMDCAGFEVVDDASFAEYVKGVVA